MTLLKTLYEKDLYPELEDAGETSYARDCLALAAERLAKGEISRRAFLRCAAMLGTLPLIGGHSQAQPPRARSLSSTGAAIQFLPTPRPSATPSPKRPA